jgi:DNA-binding PadR family transcriptional regulator
MPLELQDKSVQHAFTEKTLINFLEYLIISHYSTGNFSAYDIVKYIHRDFGILLSAGTVYNTLYSMERKELIKDNAHIKRKKVYSVTEKGQYVFRTVTSKGYAVTLIKKIFRSNSD